MRITQAIQSERALYVEVDGHQLYAFETKYTILELGYAIYLFRSPLDEEWLKKNGEKIPPDPTDSRSALNSDDALITSDPILFTLAYEHWWSMNGRPKPENTPLAIPLLDEALEVMRTREILNNFNKHRADSLPAPRTFVEPQPKKKRRLSRRKRASPAHSETTQILSRFDDQERIQRAKTLEVHDALPLEYSGMLTPRLERAAMNQATGGEATFSRYAIWAETIRGLLISAHEDCRMGQVSGETLAKLCKSINSLGAFSEVQQVLDRRSRQDL